MSNDVNINIGDIVNIKNIKTSNTFDTTNYVVMIIEKNNPDELFTYTKFTLINLQWGNVLTNIKQWNHQLGLEYQVKLADKDNITWKEWGYSKLCLMWMYSSYDNLELINENEESNNNTPSRMFLSTSF